MDLMDDLDLTSLESVQSAADESRTKGPENTVTAEDDHHSKDCNDNYEVSIIMISDDEYDIETERGDSERHLEACSDAVSEDIQATVCDEQSERRDGHDEKDSEIAGDGLADGGMQGQSTENVAPDPQSSSSNCLLGDLRINYADCSGNESLISVASGGSDITCNDYDDYFLLKTPEKVVCGVSEIVEIMETSDSGDILESANQVVAESDAMMHEDGIVDQLSGDLSLPDVSLSNIEDRDAAVSACFVALYILIYTIICLRIFMESSTSPYIEMENSDSNNISPGDPDGPEEDTTAMNIVRDESELVRCAAEEVREQCELNPVECSSDSDGSKAQEAQDAISLDGNERKGNFPSDEIYLSISEGKEDSVNDAISISDSEDSDNGSLVLHSLAEDLCMAVGLLSSAQLNDSDATLEYIVSEQQTTNLAEMTEIDNHDNKIDDGDYIHSEVAEDPFCMTVQSVVCENDSEASNQTDETPMETAEDIPVQAERIDIATDQPKNDYSEEAKQCLEPVTSEVAGTNEVNSDTTPDITVRNTKDNTEKETEAAGTASETEAEYTDRASESTEIAEEMVVDSIACIVATTIENVYHEEHPTMECSTLNSLSDSRDYDALPLDQNKLIYIVDVAEHHEQVHAEMEVSQELCLPIANQDADGSSRVDLIPTKKRGDDPDMMQSNDDLCDMAVEKDQSTTMETVDTNEISVVTEQKVIDLSQKKSCSPSEVDIHVSDDQNGIYESGAPVDAKDKRIEDQTVIKTASLYPTKIRNAQSCDWSYKAWKSLELLASRNATINCHTLTLDSGVVENLRVNLLQRKCFVEEDCCRRFKLLSDRFAAYCSQSSGSDSDFASSDESDIEDRRNSIGKLLSSQCLWDEELSVAEETNSTHEEVDRAVIRGSSSTTVAVHKQVEMNESNNFSGCVPETPDVSDDENMQEPHLPIPVKLKNRSSAVALDMKLNDAKLMKTPIVSLTRLKMRISLSSLSEFTETDTALDSQDEKVREQKKRKKEKKKKKKKAKTQSMSDTETSEREDKTGKKKSRVVSSSEPETTATDDTKMKKTCAPSKNKTKIPVKIILKKKKKTPVLCKSEANESERVEGTENGTGWLISSQTGTERDIVMTEKEPDGYTQSEDEIPLATVMKKTHAPSIEGAEASKMKEGKSKEKIHTSSTSEAEVSEKTELKKKKARISSGDDKETDNKERKLTLPAPPEKTDLKRKKDKGKDETEKESTILKSLNTGSMQKESKIEDGKENTAPKSDDQKLIEPTKCDGKTASKESLKIEASPCKKPKLSSQRDPRPSPSKNQVASPHKSMVPSPLKSKVKKPMKPVQGKGIEARKPTDLLGSILTSSHQLFGDARPKRPQEEEKESNSALEGTHAVPPSEIQSERSTLPPPLFPSVCQGYSQKPCLPPAPPGMVSGRFFPLGPMPLLPPHWEPYLMAALSGAPIPPPPPPPPLPPPPPPPPLPVDFTGTEEASSRLSVSFGDTTIHEVLPMDIDDDEEENNIIVDLHVAHLEAEEGGGDVKKDDKPAECPEVSNTQPDESKRLAEMISKIQSLANEGLDVSETDKEALERVLNLVNKRLSGGEGDYEKTKEEKVSAAGNLPTGRRQVVTEVPAEKCTLTQATREKNAKDQEKFGGKPPQKDRPGEKRALKTDGDEKRPRKDDGRTAEEVKVRVEKSQKKTGDARNVNVLKTSGPKPKTQRAFHGRSLLWGQGVPARVLPLEPLYLSCQPFDHMGEPQVVPEDPRKALKAKKQKELDKLTVLERIEADEKTSELKVFKYSPMKEHPKSKNSPDLTTAPTSKGDQSHKESKTEDQESSNENKLVKFLLRKLLDSLGRTNPQPDLAKEDDSVDKDAKTVKPSANLEKEEDTTVSGTSSTSSKDKPGKPPVKKTTKKVNVIECDDSNEGIMMESNLPSFLTSMLESNSCPIVSSPDTASVCSDKGRIKDKFVHKSKPTKSAKREKSQGDGDEVLAPLWSSSRTVETVPVRDVVRYSPEYTETSLDERLLQDTDAVQGLMQKVKKPNLLDKLAVFEKDREQQKDRFFNVDPEEPERVVTRVIKDLPKQYDRYASRSSSSTSGHSSRSHNARDRHAKKRRARELGRMSENSQDDDDHHDSSGEVVVGGDRDDRVRAAVTFSGSSSCSTQEESERKRPRSRGPRASVWARLGNMVEGAQQASVVRSSSSSRDSSDMSITKEKQRHRPDRRRDGSNESYKPKDFGEDLRDYLYSRSASQQDNDGEGLRELLYNRSGGNPDNLEFGQAEEAVDYSYQYRRRRRN